LEKCANTKGFETESSQKVIKLKNETLELHKRFTLMYTELVKKFPVISEIENREFAFLFWDKKYMIRHLGFSNASGFLSELKNIAPKHAYHSAALYRHPANKIMTSKEWLGCDFVVDIDADHMDLACQHTHDYFICTNCDYVSNELITKCPRCEGIIKKQLWLCDECLEASKIEVLKLVDDFLPDFGFTKEKATLNFSGHRGYHVHLKEDYIRSMNSNERRQIVDYITGTNFEPRDYFTYNTTQGVFIGSTIDEPGWKGRIAQNFQKILANHETIDSFDNEYGHYHLDQKIKQTLFTPEVRSQLINLLSNKISRWSISGVAQIGWEKIKQFLITISKSDIDIPVSIDTHRLIRVPGSIHGKTGFIVKPLDYYEMINFNPLTDSLIFALEETSIMKLEITTPICPEIRIKDQVYGPYKKGEIIEVPEAVAIFFTCKGVGQLL
jgi:DNA primase small subunit